MDLNAEKDRLRKEIKYYTNRIEDFHKETKVLLESSDSEDDLPTFRTPGPLISELKTTESGLQTSLQATQELTSLTVLQYETTVMVEPPKIKRSKSITEPGIWREVTAECRIDAIPFSITFCTHQGTKKFAPILYRNLSVLPVKKVHEVELGQSVLPNVIRPSDAIEVLKNYASAFRSRRTTLARLANKYTNMELEPATEGGYLLKCGSVLAITWRLENKWTPLTPFHHRMKFDLDYMKEDQVKTIKQAHKKISDPTINTDERTLLLAKIISTCLELKTTQDESMDSEAESTKKADRTIIEDAADDNLIIEYNINQDDSNKNNDEETNLDTERDIREEREKEIMAPPKSLPKKTKPKGKENKIDNRKSVKRTAGEAGKVAKKAKVVENENSDEIANDNESTKPKNTKDLGNTQKSVENHVNNAKKNAKADVNVGKNLNDKPKNDNTRPNTAENSKQNATKPVKSKMNVQNEGSQPKKAKMDENQVIEKNVHKNKVKKSNAVDKTNDNSEQNEAIQTKVAKNSQPEANNQKELNKQKNKQTIAEASSANTQTDKNKQIVSKNAAKNVVKTKNIIKPTSDTEKPTKSTTNVYKTTTENGKATKTIIKGGKTTKESGKTTTEGGDTTKTRTENGNITKPTTSTGKRTTEGGKATKSATVTEKTTKPNSNMVKTTENLPKTNSKSTKLVKSRIAGSMTSKSTENRTKNLNKQINNEQNDKNPKETKALDVPKNHLKAKNIKKVLKTTPNNSKTQTLNKNSKVANAKSGDKTKFNIKSHSNSTKIKKASNIGDKTKGIVKKIIISKISKKKFATSTPNNFMWVSPRSRISTSEKNVINTNIPRLLNKPLQRMN